MSSLLKNIQEENYPVDYLSILNKLKENYFLDSNGKSVYKLIEMIKFCVDKTISEQGEGPIYGNHSNKLYKSDIVSNAEIPENCIYEYKDILREISDYLSGSVKANHTHLAKNIIPIPNYIYQVANLISSFYMANAVTGEDSGNLLNAELETVSGLSKLIGFNYEKSGGMFTFGGTATNFYGIKVGLSKVDPNHIENGITEKVNIIGSMPAHYSHISGMQWLGIGSNNYIKTKSNLDQSINLKNLEENCINSINNGKKIACIILSGGTTSGMGIDDIKEVYDLREKLIEKYKLDYIPHIHLDSVLGWVYLNFINYDINENKLGFSKEVCNKLSLIVEKVKQFKYVDSLGIDFHKSGYVPYTSSMVIFRDKQDLGYLSRNKNDITPLFHDDNVYNPGIFTIETSRSSSNILGTWLTLKTFGQEGYQSLLGNTLENSEIIRNEISNFESNGLLVVNDTLGADIYVRVYRGNTVNPRLIFNEELNNDEILLKNDLYLNKFSKWLLETSNVNNYGISLSKTSAAFYTNTGKPYQAIRIYSLNPFLTKYDSINIVKSLVNAKKDFDKIKC